MYGWNNAQSLIGLFGIMAVCWLVSEDRRRFPFKLAAGAVCVQLALLLVLFGFKPAQGLLNAVGAGVDALAGSTQTGTQFVFGYLAGGDQPFSVTNPGPLYLFAFRVIPVILVVCALAALLWHWGVLRVITRAFGFVFQKTLGLRGAPALGTAATIFLGQVEGPIFVRAYLDKLTRSELFTLMTVGLSCVSGSTMVAYAALLKGTLPNAAAHVLTASLISAPAGVLLARILIPPKPGEETEAGEYGTDRRYDSSTDAVIRGVGDGLQVALNVGASLIVFVALVSLVDRLLGLAPRLGGQPVTVEGMLGVVFTPLAWAIGAPWREAAAAGRLLGVKLVLTEFSAFIQLGKTPADVIGGHTRMILTYAICGFANIASVGITASGFGVLAPERRGEVFGLVWRALMAGFLATCMTGALIGALPNVLFGVKA
ncbi:NupC/NupG family nucleoside CNT transporter [Caulobacter sp. S45]|uniref:NupC/NupG family nucleoside CNT transporter n=1 Tax=Caulobacter sp. S45 TaxID=1641861 RepID=UPI00131B1E03|nr:nucleoside transporter C-terminal domain-containing protein [Caulobacter sp. S45]